MVDRQLSSVMAHITKTPASWCPVRPPLPEKWSLVSLPYRHGAVMPCWDPPLNCRRRLTSASSGCFYVDAGHTVHTTHHAGWGGLKTRDWKKRDHEKYGGGKRRTGKHGTKWQGWKKQDWKTQDQISRAENARQRLLNAKWISIKTKGTLYDMYILLQI